MSSDDEKEPREQFAGRVDELREARKQISLGKVAVIVGGDQNRVDHARGRWYPPCGDRPSKWGDYNVSESLQVIVSSF